MTTASKALGDIIPPQPLPAPDAPGQFAFADADRVRRILDEGGWQDVAIKALDEPCTIDRDDLMAYVMKMGPAGAALHQADDGTRQAALDRLRAAFEPFMDGAVARFTAACWWVTARA
jgi:hypothetical protein